MFSTRHEDSAPGPSARAPQVQLRLGLPGFSYADLHQPRRLHDLLDEFDRSLRAADPQLCDRYLDWRRSQGESLDPVATSAVLCAVAPHVSVFLARLFGIEPERAALAGRIAEESAVTRFKKEFMQRRVFTRFKSPAALGGDGFAALEARVSVLWAAAFAGEPFSADPERATAIAVLAILDAWRGARDAADRGEALPEAARRTLGRLQQGLSGHESGRKLFPGLASWPDGGDGGRAALLLAELLDLLESWAYARSVDPAAAEAVRGWVSYHRPEPVDHAALVTIRRPDAARPDRLEGPLETRRRRDGFHLTDPRMSRRQALGEVEYCIFCHERDKDSCAKGLPAGKTDGFKKNPLGIELAGCPLDEKISEMHSLYGAGDPLGALALVAIDNPMCPGTGHRICNDCMKSCIYQKQEPVNIPQIETRVLTDSLSLPWGFEIWSLLTRWNPLNPRRPVALPYNGKNVLVVGFGPAGYTLAHYLLNEGFGVIGIDGLKIEPLPADLVGGDGRPPRPLADVGELVVDLEQRVLAGFGGVSEYGITVRWDKNFLTLLQLNLVRRPAMSLHGGVRFGGTLTVEDAWELGIDHVAIAAGAGKPTVVPMKNELIRGVRTASDFLMALQLTGAFKRNALANLQVRLPAVVIGGGLTAIDTATELTAYYPLQVEKVLARLEVLEAELGREAAWAGFDPEEQGILATFVEHGRAVRAERQRAARAGELPDLAGLVRSWGGVTLAYRKGMVDAPSYRLNHEEIIKAFEEGIFFHERLSPVEAVPDEFGAVAAVRFERMTQEGGRWRSSGETVELEARSVFMAAGTSPNVIYEREHPGTFELDERKEFFRGYRARRGPGGWTVEAGSAEGEPAFFTSYCRDGRLVSYYGDNHPVYEGNVVKAMASARDGYGQVVRLFADEIRGLDPAGEPERLRALAAIQARFADLVSPRVEEVRRLTPTIVEVVVRAPLAARKFQPGQFYRLQNYETRARELGGTRLLMEGLALTGAWTDPERGLLSTIVLEMGASSRLVAALRPGEPVVVMGPTGTPTEIPRGETVLLAGGGLGNAVLFSIARALKDNGNRVVYFAGYKKFEDLFKADEIEAGTDQVIWSVDSGQALAARRPQDRSFVGNIVQAMLAYAEGRLGGAPMFPLDQVDRIVAIGSDRMMAAVKRARHEVLAPHLKTPHVGIGSINSIMQCMMKEVCGQCLQRHVDPVTGAESYVFSCFNQDQHLDQVDFKNLNDRLKTNSVLEKLANRWLDHTLAGSGLPCV